MADELRSTAESLLAEQGWRNASKLQHVGPNVLARGGTGLVSILR